MIFWLLFVHTKSNSGPGGGNPRGWLKNIHLSRLKGAQKGGPSMKSDSLKQGPQNAPHRALYHALGLTEEEIR